MCLCPSHCFSVGGRQALEICLGPFFSSVFANFLVMTNPSGGCFTVDGLSGFDQFIWHTLILLRVASF